jgi:inorganic triphosphatase YgiF
MTTPAMSAEELVELVNLMTGSDSVELKLTVDHSQFQLTKESLGFDELEAQIRQVVFFDTPDLALHGGGVAVRARRIQADEGIPS